jgi:uncharacterized protein (DUF58 family)
VTPPVRPSATPPGGPHQWTGEAGSTARARWVGFAPRTPQGGLANRFRQWWLARHPATDTWTLNQHNIYILPTKSGWAFGLTLLVMLVSSINYQLNLGYVLTFLLAGSGLVSIHLTHGTLRGLTLRLRPAAAVFAGEPALLEVVMSNPGGARHGVGLRLREPSKLQRYAWCDIPALGQASASLSIVPAARGWHALPTLVVETRFPFGLFRAWTHWHPASRVLAYPKPELPAPPLPPVQGAPGGAAQAHCGQGSELDGVRAWRRDDGLRLVVWKKAARSGQLVSRETTAENSRELWLDWQATAAAGHDGVEARLSRLAAWVLAAERQGLVYGLRLNGQQFAPDRGDAHQRRLLRELALWT